MSKKLFVFISLFLIVSLLSFSGCAMVENLFDPVELEPKVMSTATADENFADDQVLLLMQKYASQREYTIHDFKKVGCIKVEYLTYEEQLAEGQNLSLLLTLDKHSKENVIEVISKLLERKDVVAAEPAYFLQSQLTPSDYGYSTQWSLPHIDLPDAWDITTGSSSVLVGIADSGIDSTHSELSGRINTTLSTNFNSGGLTDTSGHGTAVASVVGSNWNSSTTISGICQNVTLVSLKIVNSNNTAIMSALISAINYADTVGIDILNISCTTTSISTTNLTNLTDAISNYDGLIVCAAGNENYNNNNVTVYPCNIDSDNLISVGASNSSDTKWYVSSSQASSYGSSTVHVFAPGDNILIAYPSQMCTNGTHDNMHVTAGYHLADGTSLAAPHVSGVAALMLAAHPNLTAAELKTIIIESVDYCTNLANYCTSKGRINAYNAVRARSHYNYTDNGSTHSGVCSCGKTITGEAHVYEQIGTVAKCKYCNHTVQLQNVEPELETE